MENQTFSNMNTEFVIDSIMSRLDGPTLSASACACSDLRVASSDQNLWKNLCNATWPSSKTLVLADKNFYADAFPLILCQEKQLSPNPTVANASCSDLASLVDIYYKGKCVLSRVVDAIPDPTINDVDDKTKDDDEILQWLLDCPFRLDVLPDSEENNVANHDDDEVVSDNDSFAYFPSLISSGEKGKRGTDMREQVEEDIRLSWILFDKKSGKAVNLSSWKPTLVKKSWAPDGEYVLHFGSIVPIDTQAMTYKFAECNIEARFQLIQNSGYAKWTEISIRVQDMDGAHLGITKSLSVFNQALHSKRTINHREVEKANNEYKMHKKEIKRRRNRREYLVDKLYAFIGLTVLTTISYGCTTLFR